MGKGLDSPLKVKKKTQIIKGFAVCLRARLHAVVSQSRVLCWSVPCSSAQEHWKAITQLKAGRQSGRSPSSARVVGTGECGGSHSVEWGGNTQAP